MNQIEEIRNYFSSLNNDRIVQLENNNSKYISWVVKLNNSYGVGIPIDSKFEINEKFSNVKYYTKTYEIDNKDEHVLLLTSNVDHLRYEFASMCAMFLELGEDGQEREQLIADPIKWWQNFKDLIGNRTYEKTVYSVLGEMITFYHLYKKNENLEWGGPNSASVDIEDNFNSYEVKSTVIRYDSIVEISSQFQLSNKKQFLYFCRFEKSLNGYSINEIAKLLYCLGYPVHKLEEKLVRLGFEKNSLIRSEKFKLLEMREYEVNDSFPRLLISQLFNNQLMDHIVQLKYKVDLKGIESKNIDIDTI